MSVFNHSFALGLVTAMPHAQFQPIFVSFVTILKNVVVVEGKQ